MPKFLQTILKYLKRLIFISTASPKKQNRIYWPLKPEAIELPTEYKFGMPWIRVRFIFSYILRTVDECQPWKLWQHYYRIISAKPLSSTIVLDTNILSTEWSVGGFALENVLPKIPTYHHRWGSNLKKRFLYQSTTLKENIQFWTKCSTQRRLSHTLFILSFNAGNKTLHQLLSFLLYLVVKIWMIC